MSKALMSVMLIVAAVLGTAFAIFTFHNPAGQRTVAGSLNGLSMITGFAIGMIGLASLILTDKPWRSACLMSGGLGIIAIPLAFGQKTAVWVVILALSTATAIATRVMAEKEQNNTSANSKEE